MVIQIRGGFYIESSLPRFISKLRYWGMIQISSFETYCKDNSPSETVKQHVKQTVADIKQQVVSKGDQAIIDYTQQFDAPSASLDDLKLRVAPATIEQAYSQVTTEFLTALKTAKSNIEAFHNHQLPDSWEKQAPNGYLYGMQYAPIRIAGLYVPGGRALYPSSVLMNAIPAKIAKVDTLVMTTPPQKNGQIAPELLVAAKECGIDIIIKAGGAQAIFGLAYGTDSIPAVDKIVGPGNAYVDVAKQMVYGKVDIDKPAGPSEVLVYIEDVKYAKFAAAELLAQCEHDPDASAIALADDHIILEAIQQQVKLQLPQLKRQAVLEKSLKNCVLYKVKNRDQAIDAINTIASEHLCLLVDDHQVMRPKIRYAGAIFCGPYTPVALGDYVAGPNHVLPTNRAARFSSALSVMDFMTFSSHLTCSKDDLMALDQTVNVLTAVEKLDAHYKSIKQRLN